MRLGKLRAALMGEPTFTRRTVLQMFNSSGTESHLHSPEPSDREHVRKVEITPKGPGNSLTVTTRVSLYIEGATPEQIQNIWSKWRDRSLVQLLYPVAMRIRPESLPSINLIKDYGLLVDSRDAGQDDFLSPRQLLAEDWLGKDWSLLWMWPVGSSQDRQGFVYEAQLRLNLGGRIEFDFVVFAGGFERVNTNGDVNLPDEKSIIARFLPGGTRTITLGGQTENQGLYWG